MNTATDKRIVATLDAGGTNFAFSAVQGNEEIIEPIILPAQPNDLNQCLKTIEDGFQQVWDKIPASLSAISFAFPGPADYPNGIIGDLGNLPAFRGGVALGPALQKQFQIPVYINNDGDLFAYGEAIAGLLPEINKMLEKAGNPKRFRNLLGVTLGTGFGCGIVRDGELFSGDNAAAGEIWLTRHKQQHDCFAEEGVSARAVKREYARMANLNIDDCPEPDGIYEIAIEKKSGNIHAARETFRLLGIIMGEALANAISLIDGIVVIGGGISHAHKLIMPSVMNELNGTIQSINGKKRSRLVSRAFNLEEQESRKAFCTGEMREIQIPGSDTMISYDPLQRIGIGVSKLGANRAVSIGAYAFALNQLDKHRN
ncbi:MAG: ROK family protein [Fibrobacteria bacterium]|nr:ROK family protein [Fibrobacteria bacterium]